MSKSHLLTRKSINSTKFSSGSVYSDFEEERERRMQVTLKCWLLHLFFFVATNNLEVAGAFLSFASWNEKIASELRKGRPCNVLVDFNDAHLGTPGIIEKYGYPVERHWVTTEDGYILELHRIPANKTNEGNEGADDAGGRRVVLLMHGVTGSSRDFVLNCDRRALAFTLWDNGYDVWMGNYRGNAYSTNHSTLHIHSPQFWDFSIDHVGLFDVPATVDYIVDRTKVKALSYVGHSMGNGVALVMLTARPEYNDKLKIWFAMSGAVTLRGMSSPLFKIAAAFSGTIQWLFTRLKNGRFMSPSFESFIHGLVPYICRREGLTGNYHGICANAFHLIDGYNPGQIPPELASIALGEFPSSTSVKLIVQWLQWVVTGELRMFDEGPLGNLKKYGSVKPKAYPLEKMKTPVVILWGENDWIVDASDVRETEAIFGRVSPSSSLPQVESFKVASPHWNHINFLFGRDADKKVFAFILSKLNSVYHDQSETQNSTETLTQFPHST